MGEAGDVLPRVGPVDLVAAAADRDDQFDLPVDVAGRQLHRGLGSGEAARELRERHREAVRRVAGLLRVLTVVDADGEDLRGRGTGAPSSSASTAPPAGASAAAQAGNASQSANAAIGSGPKRPSDAGRRVGRRPVGMNDDETATEVLAILTSRPSRRAGTP